MSSDTLREMLRGAGSSTTTGWHWLSEHSPPPQLCAQRPQFSGSLAKSAAQVAPLPASPAVPVPVSPPPPTAELLPPSGAPASAFVGAPLALLPLVAPLPVVAPLPLPPTES